MSLISLITIRRFTILQVDTRRYPKTRNLVQNIVFQTLVNETNTAYKGLRFIAPFCGPEPLDLTARSMTASASIDIKDHLTWPPLHQRFSDVGKQFTCVSTSDNSTDGPLSEIPLTSQPTLNMSYVHQSRLAMLIRRVPGLGKLLSSFRYLRLWAATPLTFHPTLSSIRLSCSSYVLEMRRLCFQN